jgi:hypothetical protein
VVCRGPGHPYQKTKKGKNMNASKCQKLRRITRDPVCNRWRTGAVWDGLGLLIVILGAISTLAGTPLSVSEPIPANQSVSLGATAAFRITITAGDAPVSLQWRHDNTAVDWATNSTITLTNVQLVDAGAYDAMATNLYGAVTSKVAMLNVDPTFTKVTKGPIVTDREDPFAGNWGDYDGDGLLDLFVTSSLGENALYHNEGDVAGEWSFTRIASDALASAPHSWTGIWGDYDNNGQLDLFVGDVEAQSGNMLFTYLGPGPADFAALTRSDVGDCLVGDRFIVLDAAWGDYDNDGFLDLYLANAALTPTANVLYRNNGDGTFSRVTPQQAGPPVSETGSSTSCGWVDFDHDGDIDLFVRRFGAVNRLYLNDGHGRFSSMTQGSIVKEVIDDGWACWGDYDNDGFLDLFSARYNAGSALHRNLAGQDSTNVTAVAGVQLPLRELNGGAWGDYDNDGWLDLFVVNDGGTNIMFRNNSNGTFTLVDIGSPLTDGSSHVAGEFVDFDNDGLLDLFITCGGSQSQGQNLLYRNNSNSNAWLKVKLAGTASNRSGIGAKVRVRAIIGGRQFWQLREITAGNAFTGTTAPVAHFGLGDAANVTTLRVEWPSGRAEEFTNVAPRQLLTIVESGLLGELGPDRKFHLKISGNANRTYELQASTDLTDWQTLISVVGPGTDGPVDFVEEAAPAEAQRFYRLK